MCFTKKYDKYTQRERPVYKYEPDIIYSNIAKYDVAHMPASCRVRINVGKISRDKTNNQIQKPDKHSSV